MKIFLKEKNVLSKVFAWQKGFLARNEAKNPPFDR